MAKALPYTNGDLFAVPLREGGVFAVGLMIAEAALSATSSISDSTNPLQSRWLLRSGSPM